MPITIPRSSPHPLTKTFDVIGGAMREQREKEEAAALQKQMNDERKRANALETERQYAGMILKNVPQANQAEAFNALAQYTAGLDPTYKGTLTEKVNTYSKFTGKTPIGPNKATQVHDETARVGVKRRNAIMQDALVRTNIPSANPLAEATRERFSFYETLGQLQAPAASPHEKGYIRNLYKQLNTAQKEATDFETEHAFTKAPWYESGASTADVEDNTRTLNALKERAKTIQAELFKITGHGGTLDLPPDPFVSVGGGIPLATQMVNRATRRGFHPLVDDTAGQAGDSRSVIAQEAERIKISNPQEYQQLQGVLSRNSPTEIQRVIDIMTGGQQ